MPEDSNVELGDPSRETLCNLEEIVRDVAASLVDKAGRRHVSLSVQYPPDAPRQLWADSRRIRRMVTDLVGRAIDSVEGGTIVVRVGLGEATGRLRLFVESEHGKVGVSLDYELPRHGSGPAEPRPRAAAPRTTRAGAPPVRLENAPSVAARRPPLGPARILLVDDDPVNRALATLMLRRMECDVDATESGEEALAAVDGGDYDLVLMDCQMPLMDGFKTARAMRDSGCARHIPIIALTASTGDDHRARALEAGMDDFISKPITISSLHAALAPWLLGGLAPRTAGATVPGAHRDVPVFDLRDALRRTGNDWSILDEVLEVFFDHGHDLFRRLRDALSRGDATEMALAAHRLKGAASNLGGRRLAAEAQEAEQAWSAGLLDGASERIDGLEASVRDFRTAVSTARGVSR
jgi:CheY-like chemotaxis protein